MKGGDMLSMKQILCEMEACVTRLELCREENRYIDMPYLIGRLTGYNELLREYVNTKLCEGKEVTRERVSKMSQNDS